MAKILIVDDDSDFVEATKAILENNGYEVSRAENGEKALEMMKNEKPDLVLLDIMMKTVLDGWLLSKAMLEDNNLIDIPIIICSGIIRTPHAGQIPTDEYLHARDWIHKPVRFDVLLEKIRQNIRKI